MNIHENVTVKYFKDFKRVEPVEVNSSRLIDFKTCPEYYRLRHVLGYNIIKPPIYFTWGGTAHKFFESLEVLYSKREENKLSNEAIVGLSIIEAMKYWGDTKDPPPDDKKFGFMTKSRMSDLLIFVSKNWLQEKALGTMQVLAAEKSFSLKLANGTYITGTPDQQVKWGGNRYGRDFKFTTQEIKWFIRNLYPNDQLIRYTYAEKELSGEKITGQIVDIYHMTKDKGPIFHREIIAFSQEALDRWVIDQAFWKNSMDYAREHDMYPQNEKSCKYCIFHDVCRSPSQMGKEYTLKTKYKFDPWDNVREGSILLMGG